MGSWVQGYTCLLRWTWHPALVECSRAISPHWTWTRTQILGEFAGAGILSKRQGIPWRGWMRSTSWITAAQASMDAWRPLQVPCLNILVHPLCNLWIVFMTTWTIPFVGFWWEARIIQPTDYGSKYWPIWFRYQSDFTIFCYHWPMGHSKCWLILLTYLLGWPICVGMQLIQLILSTYRMFWVSIHQYLMC